jgi:hypothetical protein
LSQDPEFLKKILSKINESPEYFDLHKSWVVLTEDSGDNQYEHINKFTNILNKYNIKVDRTSNNYIIISTFENLCENYQIEISKNSIYFKLKSNNYLDEVLEIFEEMIKFKKLKIKI